MDKPQVITQTHPTHHYVEIPQGASGNAQFLKNLKTVLEKSFQSSPKTIVCFPPNTPIEAKHAKAFFQFLQQYQDRLMLVPQKNVHHWSSLWRGFLEANLPLTDAPKALAWATGQEPAGNVIVSLMGETIYMKLVGNIHEDTSKLHQSLTQSLSIAKIPAKLEEKPFRTSLNKITTWSSIQGGIIFDVADVTLLVGPVLSLLVDSVKHYGRMISAEGIYFVTASLFQSWLLLQSTGCSKLNETGNILRVTAENEPNNEGIEEENDALVQLCKEQTPPQILFMHHAQGPQTAIQAVHRFSPELIIANAISDAAYLEQTLPQYQGKIYHITPSADPRIRILSPQLLTQGYDRKLFAQYLLSRYQNNRGLPNDTNIYYLDAHPDSLKKVVSLFLLDFSSLLTDAHKKLLESLIQCESQPTQQGSFLLAFLEDKILNLEINLPFSIKGVGQFLGYYPDLFPQHLHKLDNALRLWFKGFTPTQSVLAKLHVIQDFNELFAQEPGFIVETRFQPDQVMVTVRAHFNELLERRCLSFFTILNSCEIFTRIPDKEILIELISLLLDNFKEVQTAQKGELVITLFTSGKGSEIKVFQSFHNKIVLKEQEEQGKVICQLKGDTPHTPGSQRHMLKLISLFFTKNAQDPAENNWKLACFEALSVVTSRSTSAQMLRFDFSHKDEYKEAILVSNAKEEVEIPPRSQKVFDAGCEQSVVRNRGRQITLAKGAKGEEKQQVVETPEKLQQELEGLQHTAMLREVENVKATEDAKRNERLRNIYDEALAAYNKKYGDVEESHQTRSVPKKGRKTLEMASQTQLVKSSEDAKAKARKKFRNIALTTVSVLVLLIVIFILFLATRSRPPVGPSLLLTELENQPTTVTVAPVVVTKIAEDVLSPDIAAPLVQETCRALASDSPPSQDALNALLRKLYLRRDEFSRSGDFYNLLGRLFWYKIYLDKDKLLSKSRAEICLEEAKRALDTASVNYRHEKTRSVLYLLVTSWMPEKNIVPENRIIVHYSDPKHAAKDMEILREKVAEMETLVRRWDSWQ